MKIVSYRIALTLFGILFTLGLIASYFYALHDNPPLVMLNSPVPTDQAEYQQGDFARVHIIVDVRTQQPGWLDITWVREPPLPYPVSIVRAPAVARGLLEADYPIKIPADLPEGNYHMEMVSRYQVNILPTEKKAPWHSQSFAVLKKIVEVPEPRIIIQEVDRPVYVVEYIYMDQPPSEVTVPSIGGNPSFLVSSPSLSPEPVEDRPNGVTTPIAPEPPKPVIIVIITPEPIEVVLPTKHELQVERREEHKEEIIERQEEHRAEVVARQDEHSKK